MKATDQLRDEHEGILVMLAILDRVSAKLKEEGSLNEEHFEGMLDFFRVFVDRCHHGKEEDLLFPAYEAAGIPNENGPIGAMGKASPSMNMIRSSSAAAWATRSPSSVSLSSCRSTGTSVA